MFSQHVKMWLFDVRGWFVEDPVYPFFKYDYMTKHILRGYASYRTVRCGDFNASLSANKVREEAAKSSDPYQAYGTDVPQNVPGLLQHWRSFGLDLTHIHGYSAWPATLLRHAECQRRLAPDPVNALERVGLST